MPPNKQNLKVPTSEQARINGSKGGKASVKSKRERKLMSQIYAEFLAAKYKVGGEDITGDQLMAKVMQKVLSRGDSSAVSLMKEIREATEGQKINATIEPLQVQVIFESTDKNS